MYSLSLSLSIGATTQNRPRPPSRVSSILPGLGRLLSNFYTLALLRSFTPSSQRSLSPSGTLSSWLTEEDFSSYTIVILAHDMCCASQSTQLVEFHNVILIIQMVKFLVSSNSPSSPTNHWSIHYPEDFALKNTKTMFILFR
jgi:hypothetical protein